MGLFGKPTDEKPHQPAAATPHSPPYTPAPTPAAAAPAPAPRSGAPAPAPHAGPSTACVVGANITIKGEITGDEDVLVAGTIEGQIRISRELRVGPRGKVKATVSAQSVIISGELIGDCDASNRVEIQATGRLQGNIRAPKVVITEGAVFRGNSDMSGRRDERNRAANS